MFDILKRVLRNKLVEGVSPTYSYIIKQYLVISKEVKYLNSKTMYQVKLLDLVLNLKLVLNLDLVLNLKLVLKLVIKQQQELELER